jgi:L-iditol 2-dehydrogenase
MTNKEITLKTNFRYHNIYPQTIEAVSSGRIDLSKIVSRRYPLPDARDALEDSINEKASMVKAALNFEV